jgi:hypothetical protein
MTSPPHPAQARLVSHFDDVTAPPGTGSSGFSTCVVNKAATDCKWNDTSQAEVRCFGVLVWGARFRTEFCSPPPLIVATINHPETLAAFVGSGILYRDCAASAVA